MSVITLPAAAKVAAGKISFALQRSQEVLATISGIAQVTTYPDRRWTTRVDVNPQFASDLRAWSLAISQLSDIANVFAMGPPHYSGPGTGYAGTPPVVAGADQLGIALDVDGLANSTAILSAGDFLSFDTTSAGGSTNRQLNMVTAAASSNGSGEATFSLLVPIREAPADDAAVNIFTPTAFFMLNQAHGGVEIDANQFSAFVLDAVERIFP